MFVVISGKRPKTFIPFFRCLSAKAYMIAFQ